MKIPATRVLNRFVRTCVFLTVIAGLFIPNAVGARELRPAPGTNLTKITMTAKSEDTILLGTGQYSGTIVVKNIALTIKGSPEGGTVVTGGDGPAIVQVTDKGQLTVHNVSFKPAGKSEYGVYIKESTVAFTDCKMEQLKKDGINANAGILSLTKCSIQRTGAGGIFAYNGSSVTITGTEFSTIKTDAVVLKDKCTIEVTDSTFKLISGVGIAATKGSHLKINKSNFTGVEKGGVLLEQGSSAQISECTFSLIGSTGVVSYDNSILQVDKCSFENIRKVAVAATKAKAFEVRGCTFKQTYQGVLVVDGTPEVTINNNSFIDTTATGGVIWVQASGKTIIKGNLIHRAQTGIVVKATLLQPAEISENMLIDNKEMAIYLKVDASLKIPAVNVNRNQIISGAKYGIMVSGNHLTQFSNNLILGNVSPGVVVIKGASVKMNDNFIAGPQALLVYDSAGKGSSLGANILVGGAHSKLPLSGITDRKRNMLLGQTDTEVRLKKMVENILAKVIVLKQLDRAVVDDLCRPLGAEAEKLIEASKSLAALTVRALTSTGQKFPIAFSLLDIATNKAIKFEASAAALSVNPGSYIVEPEFSPDLGKEVVIKAGQVITVDVMAKDYVLLKLKSWDSRSNKPVITGIPFQLRSTARIREDLKRPAAKSYAIRRAGATDKELEEAATLAREKLPELRKAFTTADARFAKAMSGSVFSPAIIEKETQLIDRWKNALDWAYRILAVAGNAQDADDLCKNALADKEFRNSSISLAVYIEKRLGILSNGSTIKLLHSADQEVMLSSAIRLHRSGVEPGTALLVKQFAKTEDLAEFATITPELMDVVSPELLKVMRKIVDRYLAEKAQVDADPKGGRQLSYRLKLAAADAAVYLFAYGVEKDWASASQLEFEEGGGGFRPLARIVKDIKPLVDYYLGLTGPRNLQYNYAWVASLWPVLASRSLRDREQLDRFLESVQIKIGLKKHIGKFGTDMDIKLARWQYSLAKSRYLPNRTTADFFYKRLEKLMRPAPWIIKPWLDDEIIRTLQNGDPTAAEKLDYAPQKKLEETFGPGKAGDKIHYPELFLACHRISSRSGIGGYGAFVVRSDGDPSGALSARVDIRPERSDKEIRIHIGMKFATYTHSSLATTIDGATNSVKGYFDSNGKTLIKKIWLQQGDTELPLSEAGIDNQGRFIYKAMLPADNRGLYLHLQIGFFNSIWPLDFALFNLRK